MEAEGRNYAPRELNGAKWEAVMKAEGRNYAPRELNGAKWEAVMKAEGRNYARVELILKFTLREAPHYSLFVLHYSFFKVPA